MFSDKVRRLRAENKLSQRAFAERIGVSPTTIVSYEKGGKVPAYEVLVNICREFGVSLDWLCDINADAEKPKETAADVARMVAKVMRMCNSYSIEEGDSDSAIIELSFISKELRSFLMEYSKMARLLKDKVIDQELFDLWYNKKIVDLEGVDISDMPF